MTPSTRSGRGASLVGSTLERRYRVDSLIARGGMSAVYRGLDTRLDRPVAIKVMDDQYSGDRSFVQRFEREARAAAQLYHPNIVAVYDRGVDRSPDGDLVFLTMQLVEGCTLRDLLHEHGRLPLPLALSVMEPVLSALSAAHQAGMVHRDVKPENVLIGNDGSVKVADFGLVRAAASAGTTSGSIILGTVAYLAPEQVTTGAADPSTDVYAAGIVLYELLTGTPPYVGDTALSVAYRHVNDDVPPPSREVPGLPPEVDELVLQANRRDSAARPQNAEAMLAKLRELREQLDIPVVPVEAVASAERTVQLPQNDAPSTQQLSAAAEPAGPQGTRALARPAGEDDRTEEFPAVREPAAKQPARKRRPGVLWAIAVLALAALIGGVAYWFGSAETVTVPPVTGKPEAEARQALNEVGLTPKITQEYDNSVPEGVVISSSPEEGSRLAQGREVELVVSLGKPQVPEIAPGSTVAEAEAKIRNAKLQPRLDESANQYHSTVPEGRVIGVDPAPGTRLDVSSEVTLIVSKGAPPVQVPDVRGMDLESAFATLRDAGFEPFEAAQEFDSDIEAGHVIRTDPAAGTEVRLAGRPRIGVVVSNAVTVPNFTGQQVDQAQQLAAQLGLNLDVRSPWQRPRAVVLGQLPLPGSKVEPGSTIHVTAF